MEVEEPRRLERGAAADVLFIRANDASISSMSCGGAVIMVAVYYFYEVLLQYYDVRDEASMIRYPRHGRCRFDGFHVY